MAESKYSIFLDNNQLKKDAEQASKMLKGIGDSAEAEGARIDNAFRKAAASIGISFAGISIAVLAKKMFQIRSEFQDTESSMKVFLGSAEKASDFMKKLQDYAWYNMFEFSDLTKESAKLLAFGNDVNSIIPILDKLSNIAAGTKQPLSDFVDLYNKAKNVGKIDAMGLQSWATKGVVITDVLKEMGIEVDNSAIKFEHLEKVLDKVTGAGGMFNDLMKEQMNNLSASFGQLQDDVAIMFNEIGEKAEGVMKGAIDIADKLVQNYEKVGKTILEIAATYGVYRAAIIAFVVVQKVAAQSTMGYTLAMQLQYRWLLLVQKAQELLNKTMAKNPYVLAGIAVTALAFGIYKLVTAETAAEAAQRKHNEAMEAAKEKKENLTSKTQQLISTINDETQTIYAQIKAWKELQKEMPEAFGNMTMQELKNIKPEERDKLINKTTGDREIADLNKVLEDTEKRIKLLKKQLQDAMAPSINQYGNSGIIMALSRQLHEAEETLRLKKEEKQQQDELIRQAEFEAKPNKEKLTILEQQKQELIRQKEEIEKLIPESDRVADSMDKTVSPAISNMEKGLFDVNTEWGKFDWKTQLHIGQVDFLNKKINEVGNSITAIKEIDKSGISYSAAKEQARKEWKDAESLLNDIIKNGGKRSQEAYENAVKDLDEKKKNYQALGGATTRPTSRQGKPRDYTDQINREAQALKRAYEDLEFAVEQARIDAKDEGMEKILAQNELNYKKELEQIKRHQEDMLLQLQESKKTEWMAANPKKTEDDWNKSEEKKAVVLPNTIVKQFAEQETNTSREWAKANEKAITDVAKQYQTYAEKRLEIEKKFNDDLAELEKENTDGKYDENIEELSRQMDDALAALDEEMAQKEDALKEFVMRISQMSLQQLEKALQDAEKALEKSEATGGKDSKESGIARAKVKKLQEEIKTVKTENDVKNSNEVEVWNRTASAIKKCKKEVDGILDSMDFLNEATKDALRAASNIADGAIAMIDGIKMLGIGAAASISAVEKSSVILAIIGAAIQIITAIFNMASAAEERHQEALKEVAKNKLDFQRQYNLLLLEQNLLLEEATTIFGEKQIEKAANAVKVYGDAVALFKKELQGDKPNEWLGSMPWFRNEYQKQLDAYNQGLGALNTIKIKTGHEKTGLFGWGSGRDIYSSILDVYGKDKLLNPDGTLNIDFTKTILDTQTLSDENRDLLQSLIDLQEEADKAQEALSDYLQETFGVLGNDLMDSIVASIQDKGVDAWEAFGDAGAKVIENLGKQLAYELFFADKFAKLQEELKAIYEETDDSEEIARRQMDLVGQFYQTIGDDMDAAQSFMENWQKIASEKGFNLWEDDSARQASEKGFASMSQDSANELNGRFTIMTELSRSISEGVKIMTENSGRILQHLAGIESNTKYCEHLEDMNRNIASMKYGIDDINLRGVIMKAS